jgi:class 3 adenylate cyclase/tetratricopeptide (TPR) repeat protein
MADPAALGGAGPRRDERKLVTVLLAEIEEAVESWSEPDPEDVNQAMAGHAARVRDQVRRFGGVVEQLVGGRTLAVFGLPRTREDDPVRAVRAALAIRDELGGPAGAMGPRVVVATGRALVRLGDRGAAGQRVLGEPITTGNRLLEVTPPGSVLVTEPTLRATERTIPYGPASLVTVRGGEPQAVWSPLPIPSTPGPRRLQPLVARDDELAVLVQRLAEARAERSPRMVTVLGGAGMGKSRLLAELARRVESGPELVAWRQARPPSYGGAMTLGPLADIVKAEAGILESDSAVQAERKLLATVQRVLDGGGAAEVTRTAAHLLRLVGAGTAAPAGQVHGDHREEMLGAWRRFLFALAARRPLVLAIEDAQWAGEALLDFLQSLVDPQVAARAGPAALLVVVTARPELAERHPGWGLEGTGVGSVIRLEPLDPGVTAGLLEALLAQHGLATAVPAELLERVAGNPLFAEEYVRMLRDDGMRGDRPDGAASGLAVPETVRAIVAARLDALPPDEKAALLDASVLGQVGWVGALSEIGGHDRAGLERWLRRLEDRELLHVNDRSQVAGEVEYTFRHVLVRDVAYDQTLRNERADKHLKVAEWLERLGGDRAGERADLLAYHYRAALELSRAAGRRVPGLEPRARAALRGAGDRAGALGLYAGAARAYAEALELCPPEPGNPERAELLLRLGRARCRADGGGEEELTAARELFLAAGQEVAAAEAEMLLGELAFLGGRGEERAARLERALALIAGAAPSPTKAAVLRGCMLHLAIANRHAEARAVAAQVLELARRFGLHDFEADALGTIGLARVDAGDPAGVADLRTAIAALDRLGLPGSVGWRLNLAYALAALGDLADCHAELEVAARHAERFGLLRSARAIRLHRVAEHYWTGRWDEAVAVVDALVATSPVGDGHYLEWECRMWRGRIRLARGDLEGALADSATALELARRAGDPMALDPALAFRASALLAGDKAAAAAEAVRELLDELGGSVMAPEVGADLGASLAALGLGTGALDALGIPPSPWLEATRALAAGSAERAAELYARIGARPEEAAARLQAARQASAEGRAAAGEALLEAAMAFYREVGAEARLAEGRALGTGPARRSIPAQDA